MGELNPLIHQRTRLRIMAALVSLDEGDKAGFAFLRDLLERTDGNKPQAAEQLGISLKTLYNKLNQATNLEQTA